MLRRSYRAMNMEDPLPAMRHLSDMRQIDLEALQTSRASEIPTISLPGVGHPYWQQARAHLRQYQVPPTIAINLSPNRAPVTRKLKQALVDRLKDIWTTSRNNMFDIDYNSAEIYNIGGDLPVIRMTVHRVDHRSVYQDGSPAVPENTRAYHGTRPPVVPFILDEGIKSSPPSHGITGLWMNIDLVQAMQWTNSIFDITPGLAIEIVAPDHIVRHNRRIRGTSQNQNRYVAELLPGQQLPAVHVSAIICAIPTLERVKMLNNLYKCVKSTVDFIADVMSTENVTFDKDNYVKILWTLCSYRYPYINNPDALRTDFGGPMDQVPACLTVMSLHFTACLFYLIELTSENNKRQKLASIDPSTMPPPMIQLLTTLAPQLVDFWSQRPEAEGIHPTWKDYRIVHVHRWGPLDDRDNREGPV